MSRSGSGTILVLYTTSSDYYSVSSSERVDIRLWMSTVEKGTGVTMNVVTDDEGWEEGGVRVPGQQRHTH